MLSYEYVWLPEFIHYICRILELCSWKGIFSPSNPTICSLQESKLNIPNRRLFNICLNTFSEEEPTFSLSNWSIVKLLLWLESLNPNLALNKLSPLFHYTTRKKTSFFHVTYFQIFEKCYHISFLHFLLKDIPTLSLCIPSYLNLFLYVPDSLIILIVLIWTWSILFYS